MSMATVKVYCQLAIFLVAFLDHGIATRAQEEFNAPDSRSVYGRDPYSEFTDDVASNPVDYSRYEREKRYVRSRRYAEEGEFQEPERNEFDKEQYWNQDEVEVEEDTVDPEGENIKLARKKRQSSPPPEYRYKNHRYEQDSMFEESRQIPKIRKVVQYEVFESEDEPISAETHIDTRSSPPPPERFVYQGVQYVRAPEQLPQSTYQVRREGSPEHYHRIPGSEGPPPVSRYQQDQSGAATGKSHGQSRKHASGGGDDGHEKHSSAKGHKADKGYKSNHHNEHGAKGKEGHEKHAKQYDEHGGKKHNHHDAAGHYGQHHEAAHGQKGAKFDEKKGHKKGHNTKGYHNKYHKDEYHKEHKFYDDYHKSGSHSRYGDFNSKHNSKEGGSKKKSHLDSAHHEDHAGKKGHYDKGHVDEDHKGHKNEKGYEKHHAQHSDYGKKGGHQGGSQYAYHTKH